LGFGICIDGRYIQDHFPGIGRYTFNLIGALARIAPEEKFSLLLNPGLINTRYDIAALARYPNVELVRVHAPTRSLREQWELPHVMQATTQDRPYVFHAPYFIKPYFLRAPSIVTIFDLIPLRASRGVSASARLFFRLAIMLAVQTSRRIIVPSLSARDDLAATLGVAREKPAVIPLAADARFRPMGAPERERVRAKYSLPDKYILYVGINKPHKNLETLVAAWERAGVDAGLVIAGAWDERYGERLREKEIKIISNIDDADLPALYSAATVFATASLYEGFGLPLLEAMACGAPCISSSASSLPEVGGDAVLYFDPRDADALAQLIARVVNDRAAQKELRGKSLARAASPEFSWERTASETLRVYKQVAKG